MVVALQRTVMPKLRIAGFRGSFPHLRRPRPQWIDLLTFQFDRYGGGVVIEIARCPVAGFMRPWGPHVPPNKVTAWDVYTRKRVQSHPEGSTVFGFRFDDGDVERPARQIAAALAADDIWDDAPFNEGN
jgi:hypothetical protein